MYKTASRFQQSTSHGDQVRSDGAIRAEHELQLIVRDQPEYQILITNLINMGLSAFEIKLAIKRLIKSGARPTHVRLLVNEPLKSRDFKEFREYITVARDSLNSAAIKLGARGQEDGLLTKVNSIQAELRELAEALGIAEV